MRYEDFFDEVENKKYIKYKDNTVVKAVFQFIDEPESIEKMILSTEQNRPALEGVIEDIEAKFPASLNFDLANDYTLRKALGSMVKYIISDFGYEVNTQKNISRGNHMKSATHYKFNSSKATKRIVKKVAIEDI